MKTFRTSRAIPTSPQAIFESMSNPDKLARWWGPAGFTNRFTLFQFEPGGSWSHIMRGPDGREYPNESEFIDITEPERVVIRHLSKPEFVLTITVTSADNGAVVDWVQEFESEAVAKQVAHIVEPSNEQNLDRLTVVACGG